MDFRVYFQTNPHNFSCKGISKPLDMSPMSPHRYFPDRIVINLSRWVYLNTWYFPFHRFITFITIITISQKVGEKSTMTKPATRDFGGPLWHIVAKVPDYFVISSQIKDWRCQPCATLVSWFVENWSWLVSFFWVHNFENVGMHPQ
jgi:hypothetical protein